MVTREDNARDVSSLTGKTRKDENGFTHYVFSKAMFDNPWYEIPEDNVELVRKFLVGGSREYPSDGGIPCDIVAIEVRKLLNHFVEIAKDPNDKFYEDAQEALKYGRFSLVRGTVKLYLAKYTTRDWRRKRYTDDIDFWLFKMALYEHVMKANGWKRVPVTKEWQKTVHWYNYIRKVDETKELIAANDINLVLDFGSGSYLEGTSLKDVFRKKIKRGHNVDISDMINVAMVKGANGKYREDKERQNEWNEIWTAFEEAANARNKRTTSNFITLCRYSLAIANHLERTAIAIEKYHELIFDREAFPDDAIDQYCSTSIHWMKFLEINGPNETRKMIHNFLIEQKDIKPQHAKNLRELAEKVLKIINSRYKHLKVIFEIEN